MMRVLFVCMGNICRSPAAEAVMRQLDDAKLIEHIDSCGVGDWYAGHAVDERMRQAASKRGIKMVGRARPIEPADFDLFDWILVADRQVLQALYAEAPKAEQKAKLRLLTSFSGAYRDEDIPDPYFGGISGFESVLDMIQDSCKGFYATILGEKT